MTHRIDALFARLAAENRPAFVTYVMAGDPDPATAEAILQALPKAGADIVEFGMPFSDPMADGPAIQASALRALQAGQTMRATLDAVRRFREGDDATPVVLMGYYNPIFRYGPERFLDDAKQAGVDGFIVVDLPPEADDELCLPALGRDLAFIRLATPTTDEARLPRVLENTAGFLYYVSIAGITGAAAPNAAAVGRAVRRIKERTDLPVCVGFGIRDRASARAMGAHADGVVVGTAIVNAIAGSLRDGRATDGTVGAATALVREIAAGVREAREVTAREVTAGEG